MKETVNPETRSSASKREFGDYLMIGALGVMLLVTLPLTLPLGLLCYLIGRGIAWACDRAGIYLDGTAS